MKRKRNKSTLDRFNSKYIVDKSGCWIWTDFLNSYGRGVMCIDGKTEHASRISYRLFNGDFDKNLWVLHKCDNPSCVNPDHLFLGTPKDNSEDMVKKGRSAKGMRVGNSKLSDIDVIMIREAFSAGVPRMELIKRYNVSYTVITKVIYNETWKHV